MLKVVLIRQYISPAKGTARRGFRGYGLSSFLLFSVGSCAADRAVGYNKLNKILCDKNYVKIYKIKISRILII